MYSSTIPTYTIHELNSTIGKLLERAFSPLFCVNASISQSQLKKGHLWLTLTDGTCSINAVVWSSQLKAINYLPKEGDGVLITGKLNFWKVRATLAVQVFDIRPSISTVLRQFEVNRDLLLQEGLIDESRKRKLPNYPSCVAILTSVPSSALADMLRTAKEQWPLAKLIIIPIPVQGNVANKIKLVFEKLLDKLEELQIETIILARGGGSREDLMVFDDENLCRALAGLPVPLVTGIGHEDDLTVADLVADYRAATPTAAIVTVLPQLEVVTNLCLQKRQRLTETICIIIQRNRLQIVERKQHLKNFSPDLILNRVRNNLNHKKELLDALSPNRLLQRGFSITKNQEGIPLISVKDVNVSDKVNIELVDGLINATIDTINLNNN